MENKENIKAAEQIEDIILRHSGRGMQLLREFLPENYCREAAAALLELDRGEVLLLTGFYVAGYAETDGPVGTYALAMALKKLGFTPCVVCDKYCRDFFEPEGLAVEYVEPDADEAALAGILERRRPQAVVSIERCGRNGQGHYANMRGVVIDEFTAPLDELLTMAREQGILTVGVGDGGNEIGMGNLREQIAEKLALTPCVVEVDRLVIASVSNWGAYGLCAWLGKLSGQRLAADFEDCRDFIARTVAVGSVDGISHELVCTVDGFGMDTEQEILDALKEAECR